MRSRKSLKLKSMLGRVSAILGASCERYGAWEPEREEEKRDGVSMRVAMLNLYKIRAVVVYLSKSFQVVRADIDVVGCWRCFTDKRATRVGVNKSRSA